MTSDPQSAGAHADPHDEARMHLRAADPVLAKLIDENPGFDPREWLSRLPRLDAFGALLFQIVGQQLSVRSTRAIVGRIEALFGGRMPSADELLATDPEVIRAAGLSRRKVETLRVLAQRFADGELGDTLFLNSSDDEIEAKLTSIPGIGPWTVRGFLILALDRPDVFPAGDLALRRIVGRLYGLGANPTEDQVLRTADRWRPYRSLAAGYLFQTAFGA
jgi:DNA-3-methyladenine glycosylase II